MQVPIAIIPFVRWWVECDDEGKIPVTKCALGEAAPDFHHVVNRQLVRYVGNHVKRDFGIFLGCPIDLLEMVEGGHGFFDRKPGVRCDHRSPFGIGCGSQINVPNNANGNAVTCARRIIADANENAAATEPVDDRA